MPGAGGPLEPRLRAVTAANSAAVKAAKRAHLAAALAVQSAVPPRPRSRYFTRNRSDRTGFSKRFGSRKGGRDKEDGGEKGKEVNEESVRRRSSEDSTSSVSPSITSSGVSSDYTTEDDNSDYITEDEDDKDDEEEEEGEHQARAAVIPKASGAGPIASSPERQQALPPRIGSVAAAIEAVAAARARLRQPSQFSSTANCLTGSTTTAGGGAGTGHGGARGSAADSQHLPPVVPRNKGGADAPHSVTTTVTAANIDSKLPEAGSGGLSGLRLLASTMQLQQSSPMAATASRRSALLTAGPSGKGMEGTVATPPTAAGVGCGATQSGGGVVAGDRDSSGNLADWVAQRFRSGSRLAMHADAGTSAPLPRSLPGSSGSVSSSIGSSIGDASSGLRGLLAARSDGVASWYSRPTRWHEPVTPGGASHASLLDLRPPVHGSAASVFVAPVSLASPLLEYQRKDGLAREVV